LRTPARETSPVEIVRRLEKFTYLRELAPSRSICRCCHPAACGCSPATASANRRTLRDDDVRHIHPVHHEHINPFGHYRFDNPPRTHRRSTTPAPRHYLHLARDPSD